MPRPLECDLTIKDGNKKVNVGQETRHLMGTIEGPWWFRYSWWVIPLGLILLIGPWVFFAHMDDCPTPPALPSTTTTTVGEVAPQDNGITVVIEQSDPDPASVPPPPEPEVKVIKEERRIYRIKIPPR
jgi:hypothetical protein